MGRLRSGAARIGSLALVVAVAAGYGLPSDVSAGEEGSRCPVRALERSEGPVEITFWHVQQATNEEILVDLIDQFEASQDQVRVELLNVVTYPDIFEKYQAGLATGDLPDLVQMDETALQSLVDSKSTVPVALCAKSDDYQFDDFLSRAIEQYTLDGTLRAMPWTVSNPVLLYDKNAFRDAGLDPEDPPGTLDEVIEYSQQIVDAGAARNAMAIRAEASVNEAMYAKARKLYMNHRNGREGRATKAFIDTATGRTIWRWWNELIDADLGYFTGSRPDNVDNLFALGTGDAAMTIDVSSVVGSMFAILESGQFADLDLGIAPLPGIEPGGGVPVGDGSLWIPNGGSPEERAAAWELIKFLSAPEQQAAYAVGSRGGYLPIRKSAVDDPDVQQMWEQNPELRVPYDQLQAGQDDAATLGAVTGDYEGVRTAVRDSLTAMLADGLAPDEALARAQRDANAAIQEYNERVGT